jgi:hypothetical protein
MSTRTLLVIEVCLVGVAAVIVYLIVDAGWGGSSDATGEREEALAAEGTPGSTVLAASVTPSQPPTPSPTPRLDRCGPPVDRDYLASNQVLAYYGNPYTDLMGILGEVGPEELVARLRSHAATYDALNGPAGIRPAFHIVYGRATLDPGREGNHLLYVDDDTMKEYIDLACKEGFLVFVDLQIGLSDVDTEVKDALRFLDEPNVHLAIDPEFAMPPGEIPGETVGTVDAADVNAAQAALQAFTEEHRLGDKMLVVHKFVPEMVTRPELLQQYPNVRLVIDMDGFGPAELKRVKYGWFQAEAEHTGIKLFFKQDPDLMSETDVLGLQPDVIIYQ